MPLALCFALAQAAKPLLVGRHQTLRLVAASPPALAPAAAIHDHCNLIALPVVVALVAAAFASSRWRRPLAVYLLIYMIVDASWILLQPSVVRAPTVLLSHHAATVLLLCHSLTHPPHLRYVAALSIVEVNTLLLIARRNVRRSAWLEAAFYASWIAVRAVWFPCLAVHLWRLPSESWPNDQLRGPATRRLELGPNSMAQASVAAICRPKASHGQSTLGYRSFRDYSESENQV